MFTQTHTSFSPRITVRANNKGKARLETIRSVLSTFDYDGKGEVGVALHPDPHIASRYHRASNRLG